MPSLHFLSSYVRTAIFHMHVGYLNLFFKNPPCVTFILSQKSDLRVFLLSVKAMHTDNADLGPDSLFAPTLSYLFDTTNGFILFGDYWTLFIVFLHTQILNA